MKRPNLLVFLSLALPLTWGNPAHSQIKKADDVQTLLKQMLGCFEVTFTFIEDGNHDAFYEPVLEKAESSAEDPLTINHILMIEGQSQLHWSEQWTPLDGRHWRQKVTGPFGDERYVCEGEWILNQLSCLSPKAAKPRRDQARPYAFLQRGNTLQINAKRWVHSQVNRKINEDGSLYAVEAGWNLYQRVDDQRCSPAKAQQ